MPSNIPKPEEIVGEMRGMEIVLGQGGTTAEGCWLIGGREQTYYSWRKEYSGRKVNQARRIRDLEKEISGFAGRSST